ncbi:hypothetical protein H0H81_000556 [Sphagnurus paluster]|uniref:L-tryptophan decarboxylase PsiD-like domain-containing protein n=1 Tax=Sphagnurus paluster TaxID=117069 RepID=A0A9P7FPC8_9AGAR|nr:hypothetical protein H0H81_000556 [Sphagnurus paluster]
MSATSQTVGSLRDGPFASSPFNNAPILMSVGGWIPDAPDHLNDWLEKKLKELEREPMNAFPDKSIADFRKLIEENAEVWMGFHRLFENVPEKDPLGRRQVKDYDTMLRLFNRFIQEAPEFDNNFLVFLPFTAVLQWPMALANGLTILINPLVNDHFRRVFKVWSDFLGPPASRAYESKVLRIAYDVKERDHFWLKGQPYSLVHMLNNHPEARSFIGGTVYQAFLSPFYYHRWSSPVDGIIERVEVVEGTYFAGVPSDEPPPPEYYAFQGQQPFLAQVATRALIFIRAHDPRIGRMCFIGIGMVEVSSCDITVLKGQEVKKGQEIGTFHFGGSTHCLVFGPATKLDFVAQVGELIPVHRVIAHLKSE